MTTLLSVWRGIGRRVRASPSLAVGGEAEPHEDGLRPTAARPSDRDVSPVVKAVEATPDGAVRDNRIAEEARRFGEQDNKARRKRSWGSIPHFRHGIAQLFDMGTFVKRHLQEHDHPVALTVACGDMSGEYPFFKRVGVAEIDAMDISEGQRDKFFATYDGTVPVNYTIGDANELDLEAERYDLVYLQHAYHHVEALEHVADQISKSLKPHGILAISDYIGANYLQRTPRQRDLCGAIWRAMPERYRVADDGRVLAELRIPRKESLSPYEAVRSEDIVDVLTARFETRELVQFAGILFPIFNDFAQNYTDSPEDQEFVRMMWDLDRWLVQSRRIEANFMKAIFVPKR